MPATKIPDEHQHKLIKVLALNCFGSGGHPMATTSNLDYFQRDYTLKCLDRVAKSKKINPEGRAIAVAAMAAMVSK